MSPPGISPDDPALRAVVIGLVSVERVKSVVAVVRGVDEDAAERVLTDVAREAGVPLWAASDQVLANLQTQVGTAGLTPDTLDRALDAVCPAGSSG
ncbi:hypothetical protein [Promicromonospora sp. NPDC050880]|uniref:hypothetical protein n=1 Tax=unclassified Promicromonospora TaxID=2647929 RepID=UPI00379EC2FB